MAKRSLNLVIGCGGSGLTTLSSLNRLLVQNPTLLPRLSDEVYYLAVDTEASALDQFEKEIHEQMGQYPAPFMQRIQLSHNMNILNEMIRPNFIEPFSGQPNAKGLTRLREHWWFDRNGNPFVAPRVTNLIKGAGQCPPASYGLAWYHLDEIGDAIKRIVNHMVAHGYGDPTQLKNMNLVVVAGLSGGTGRGCWNLIAFKVREYLLSKYKVTVPPVGVFFDANVYESVARNNEGQQLALEVNSLTGLSELSCWMMNGGKAGTDCFKYSLPSIKSPDRASTDVLKVNLDLNPTAGAPVNSAFLICGKSESAILDNNRQYHEMAGAALYAMIANPDIAARQVNDGDPFNSFAAATYEVDTLHLQKWYETRARGVALRRLVSSGEDVSSAKDAFFRAYPINALVRALTDLRPNSQGTLFQRLSYAFLKQKKYNQSFATMVEEFPTWKFEDAKEAVDPLLAPASDVKAVVRQVLSEMNLGSGKVEAAVVAAMKAVYKGDEGQKPSIGRALDFLKMLKSEIEAARSLSPQVFQITPEGGSKAIGAREAVEKTLKAFSKRTLKEMVTGIGAFNQDEIDQLVRDEAGCYVGIIPNGVLAANYPQLKAALEEAFQPAVKRVERLIAACEQFANCCREASSGFALEEAEAAGGKAGDDSFSLLFATPDRIEDTLYDGDDCERFYHRVLRPIVASRAEAEDLVGDSIMIGDGMEDFIGRSIENGAMEKLAVASDSASHRKFVGKLMDETRASVSLSENFLEDNFTFEKILLHNRDYWNDAIAAAMGNGVRLTRLKELFERTLGAELVQDRQNRKAPLTLPPIEELRKSIAASLASTCAPWWIADTDGAHHSIMMFLPFDCGEAADEISKYISDYAPHARVQPIGLDTAKGSVTPFSYVAFVSEGVKLSSVEKSKGMHLLDKIESLKYYHDADVNAWMQMTERDDGESIFTTDNHNKGIGYLSPLYIREKALSGYRWRPWMHEDEAEAQREESKALDAMLYGFLGMGLTDAAAKAFDEKFATYGWHFPILKPGDKQSYSLARKTYVWNEDDSKAELDTECDWKSNKRLCTSACNLLALLQGKGKTGLTGTAKDSDVELGNKVRELLLKEAEVFAEQVEPEIGTNDIGKLKRARTAWLTQMRDAADDDDKPVFDALLRRSKANS